MSFFEKFQQNSFGSYEQPEPWDLVAHFYDFFQWLGLKLLKGTGEKNYEQLAQFVIEKTDIGKGGCHLDAACGTGYLHPAIHEKIGQSGTCHAVDFSSGMLKKAQEKAVKEERLNFEFHCLDLHQLEGYFPPCTFDSATLSFALPILSNPVKVLQAINNSLKPGCKLVVLTLSREQMEQRRRQFFWRALIRQYHKRYQFIDELKALFEQSGFDECIFDTLEWVLIIEAFRHRPL